MDKAALDCTIPPAHGSDRSGGGIQFNSFAFAVFLSVCFCIYWLLPRFTAAVRWHNAFLIALSCVFYGWWDPRVVVLLLGVASIAYVAARVTIGRRTPPRWASAASWLGIVLILGILGFFKYADFFASSFASLLHGLGLRADTVTLHVVLPIGISFYVFMAIAYVVDVRRGRIPAMRDPITFFAFSTFFPQLLAGPIGRAPDLLPQYGAARTFDDSDARDALRQMLWGLVKKMVIADNIAVLVDKAWGDLHSLGGLALVAIAFLYSIQIYCDFSGYSDLAIGTARLFGIRLMRNFHYPYLATSISDFWRRWHISLSSWFRDYVYIPLGGSRVSDKRRYGNILVTFSLTGLWHGAGWTFVVWGLLHGLYYLPLQLWQRYRYGAARQVLPPANAGVAAFGHLGPATAPAPTSRRRVFHLAAVMVTFIEVSFAWIFFRAPSLSAAFTFIGGAADPLRGVGRLTSYIPWLGASAALLLFESTQRDHEHPLELRGIPLVLRWAVYICLMLVILFVGSFGARNFIYVQF